MPRYLTPALLLAALLCGTAINPAGAQSAATSGVTSGVHVASMPTDVSAAKRKHRTHRHVYVAPAYGPPVFGPPAYSQWRGSDPSYGPGTPQLRARQLQGACVIDEGYGRYSACSNR